MNDVVKNVFKIIGYVIGLFLGLLSKTIIVFIALEVLRNCGFHIYDFTFWEVFLIRWGIVSLFPTKLDNRVLKEKE